MNFSGHEYNCLYVGSVTHLCMGERIKNTLKSTDRVPVYHHSLLFCRTILNQTALLHTSFAFALHFAIDFILLLHTFCCVYENMNGVRHTEMRGRTPDTQ